MVLSDLAQMEARLCVCVCAYVDTREGGVRKGRCCFSGLLLLQIQFKLTLHLNICFKVPHRKITVTVLEKQFVQLQI